MEENSGWIQLAIYELLSAVPLSTINSKWMLGPNANDLAAFTAMLSLSILLMAGFSCSFHCNHCNK